MADGQKRILVVDDEPSIVKIIRKQLEICGYAVAVASDGEDGLKQATEQLPDLIVLDVMLPKKNGFEVCTTLKQQATTAKIPILMLTARAQRRDYDEGVGHGANAFLTKPFSLDELAKKIAELLAVPLA